MITRRGLFSVVACGIVAPLTQLAPKAMAGVTGKYIPRRITAMHIFAGDLSVWDMATGEEVSHVLAIDVDAGLARVPKFVEKPLMIYKEEPGVSADVFSSKRVVPHPTKTCQILELDSDGNIQYDTLEGRFELNWKERKVPERIERMREALPRKMWNEICTGHEFDITSITHR